MNSEKSPEHLWQISLPALFARFEKEIIGDDRGLRMRILTSETQIQILRYRDGISVTSHLIIHLSKDPHPDGRVHAQIVSGWAHVIEGLHKKKAFQHGAITPEDPQSWIEALLATNVS